jgi:DNA-binding XRE family transcriptional regulator
MANKPKKKALRGVGQPWKGISPADRKRFDGSVVLVLAENIHRLRLVPPGLTQEQLAAEAGLGRNTIIEIEKAMRATNIVVVEQVAAALGVKPYELLKP